MKKLLFSIFINFLLHSNIISLNETQQAAETKKYEIQEIDRKSYSNFTHSVKSWIEENREFIVIMLSFGIGVGIAWYRSKSKPKLVSFEEMCKAHNMTREQFARNHLGIKEDTSLEEIEKNWKTKYKVFLSRLRKATNETERDSGQIILNTLEESAKVLGLDLDKLKKEVK